MSSSSSDSSGPLSKDEAKKNSPAYLALRILRKLQASPLEQTMAIADHQKATDAMMRLRDLLVRGLQVDQDVAACLTCAGIAVHRRILIGPEQLGAAEHLRTTQALLFVLVVLATGGNEASPTGDYPANPPPDVNMNIAAWESSALWEQMRSADDAAATSSWAHELRDPGTLCRTILQLVRSRPVEPSLLELSDRGGMFFRASAAAMAASLLDSVAPVVDGNDFLTLDAVSFVHQVPGSALRVEALQGIADCAESEAGQTVHSSLCPPPPSTPPPPTPFPPTCYLVRCCGT